MFSKIYVEIKGTLIFVFYYGVFLNMELQDNKTV